jgi:hypothetical protein
MNLRVNLTKGISTPEGFRYCSVVMSGNGRVKPGAVIVNGQEERHLEGAYYIDWYEGDTRKRKSVGKDPATALARKLRKETDSKRPLRGSPLRPKPRRMPGGRLRPLAHPSWKKPSSPRSQRPTRLITRRSPISKSLARRPTWKRSTGKTC